MAYQMLTRTGRNFYEVTSAMQNAIRKGDYDLAGYALWELLPQYTPYLRKRLLVISAEDCYGILTKEILPLCEYGTEDSLTKALALLCSAKKNRDADYFVCNLMYADQPSGLDKHTLMQSLSKAIRKRDMLATGRYAAELFKLSRKDIWKVLNETMLVYYPFLESEFAALQKSNDIMTKPNEETIFVAKAIVLMWTKRENGDDYFALPNMDLWCPFRMDAISVPKPIELCPKVNGMFPEWAYNWHTTYGKYTLRRDAVHAIENDQRLLTPLEVNLFDNCSWNRDINACLMKHNPNRYRLPFDDRKPTVEQMYGQQN